ncbi:MAG: ATP-binding protein [Rickettsiales bacterium]|nr:ATP-binding protein [Rickettsiales bacterium]
MSKTISQNINRKNLIQLLLLRSIAIIGQIATILFVHFFLKISLPLTPMFLVIFILAVINLFSFYRYQTKKNISDKNLFCQVLLDVFSLTAQLYFSGGISNPFISLFLLQVIIGAILLSRIYSWLIGVITILCYGWLSFNYHQLDEFHHHLDHGDFFNLHLQGMLISYIFAAILLLIFVTKIIKNLKERDKQIGQLKQQAIEKEQVVKMGLFATSAAHELSTPLSTISVILADWKKMQLAQDLIADVELAEAQLLRCKKILSEILSSSKKTRLENAQATSLKKAFDSLIKDWSELRLPKNLHYEFIGKSDKKIILTSDLALAFFNIFDNALEESPQSVSIFVNVINDFLKITVEDQGKGFSDYILNHIGHIAATNFTTKNGNNGIGLFLAINTVATIGGNLELSNKKNGGAKVEITIPIKNL